MDSDNENITIKAKSACKLKLHKKFRQQQFKLSVLRKLKCSFKNN